MARGRSGSAPGGVRFARLRGDAVPSDKVQRAGGVTEVHVYRVCLGRVPTPRAQVDPSSQANERLTADRR